MFAAAGLAILWEEFVTGDSEKTLELNFSDTLFSLPSPVKDQPSATKPDGEVDPTQ